nr:hypothetical protein [Tanacetum cinerariifolium]
MKACLICSQVVITPGLSSLNHTFASPARDDGTSLSLITSALVLPYQNIPQILMNSVMYLCRSTRARLSNWRSLIIDRRYKKKFRVAQKISNQAAETASQAAGGDLVFTRDEPADSDGQPGGWLVPVERKLKIFSKQ